MSDLAEVVGRTDDERVALAWWRGIEDLVLSVELRGPDWTDDKCGEEPRVSERDVYIGRILARWLGSDHGRYQLGLLRERWMRLEEHEVYQRRRGEPSLRPGTRECGTLFSMRDFCNRVEDGSFIDDDGFGQYAIAKSAQSREFQVDATDHRVSPSEIERHGPDPRFTHVLWFNR